MLTARSVRIISCLLVICFLFCSDPASARRKKRSVYRGVTARSAMLSDSANLKQYYGKNAHKKVSPASTAKVMTALLVLERLPLDQYVTVSSRARNVQPSMIYLRPGEQYRVADLLFALLLNSANDASIVLAEAVAGSEYKFVTLMNARAKALGASRTHFVNSNGLPRQKVSQYTTAYDMTLIFRQALKHAFFREAIETSYKTIYSKSGRKISLKSHNKILFFTDWKKKVYGKTGYTHAAGACFVGMVKHKDRMLILAVFGCKKRWQDIKHIISKYGGVVL